MGGLTFRNALRISLLGTQQMKRGAMTPAERQKLWRDRIKAGLVRLEFWVPSAAADEVKQAVTVVVAEQKGEKE